MFNTETSNHDIFSQHNFSQIRTFIGRPNSSPQDPGRKTIAIDHLNVQVNAMVFQHWILDMTLMLQCWNVGNPQTAFQCDGRTKVDQKHPSERIQEQKHKLHNGLREPPGSIYCMNKWTMKWDSNVYSLMTRKVMFHRNSLYRTPTLEQSHDDEV